jgi:putative CocE/NonD family hydrolase
MIAKRAYLATKKPKSLALSIAKLSPCLLLSVLLTVAAIGQDDSGVRIERDVAAQMRDGVVLRADVYRPAEGGPWPVLVERTPYGKQGLHPEALVKAGYIVVCQDARGRYASDGKFESFYRDQTHDGEDGYDTVEWAAKLPGSTGKVGTFGPSYNAFLQWRLAALRPPSLVAMAAQTIPARLTDLEGPGTIRPGRRLLWFFGTISPDLRRRAGGEPPHTGAEARKIWDAGEGEKLLWFLPWQKLPQSVFEDEGDVVRAWLAQPGHDPWKLDEHCREVSAPNLDIVGWYDHCNGDMLLHRTMVKDGMTETARKNQRLIVGPWSHNARGRRAYGEIDFGPAATMNVVDEEIRWFDYWLKGKSNGIDRQSSVRIFVMGTNEWRDEAAWPLTRARATDFYLTSGGDANTPAGNGRLVRAAPAAAGRDEYRYDPADPVRSLYGTAMYTIPADQRPLASRRDILVYQSEPLAEALEVTGNPEVELFASSSAPDTDFFVRLIDVAPDGMGRDVSLGMVRARYRESLDKPLLLKPGEITRFRIRMNPMSNVFLPGHRLRLDVTSSDFPNYDRNHNTAADQNADAELATAQQTIYHGPRQASRVILPVVGQ